MSNFHLAGIIPVSSIKLNYNLPYHPCLLPIEEDFLLIHRSILECAWAGCETIWIVMDPDITPIFRKVVGDYVYDPVNYYRAHDIDKTAKRTMIPIYFTTVDVRNRGKRDCYGWSIIEGAYMAYRVSNQLSKWIIPDKYYVSFPWAIYPPEIVREHRKLISSTNNPNFMITNNNEGVKGDKYLGFTFEQEDFINCRAFVRENGTGRYVPGGKKNEDGIPRELLPIEKRWSARNFKMSEVFCKLPDDVHKIELDYYYDVTSWNGYREFMSSDLAIEKPRVKEWLSKSRYKKDLLDFQDL
tara:strand:- start:72 stop:965 length:894 start_codon:yes stop_codon:yes gene_type:complete